MHDLNGNLFRICLNKTNALDLNVVGAVDMDDSHMKDISAYDIDDDDIWVDDMDMDEWRPNNQDYTYKHWYDILEQSYDPTVDLDADVGNESDDDNMVDVMVDLAFYKIELKIMELQL
jgi:hypothetical protein